MNEPKLQLSWNAYQNNICKGLGLLQQKGEFVDMTIAADGHHVKVHQMVLSLISPFIKDLIASAQCPHPVIFLNKISYHTLEAILEYAYTGEVLVNHEGLDEFLSACKSLHIKGLEADNFIAYTDYASRINNTDTDETKNSDLHKTVTKDMPEISNNQENEQSMIKHGVKRKRSDHIKTPDYDETVYEDDTYESLTMDNNSDCYEEVIVQKKPEIKYPSKSENPQNTTIQYSLSCQGSIQLVVNRYIYHMRHLRVTNERVWRCYDYNTRRCDAFVVTKDNMIVERGCAHNHPFHDKQILKRVRSGNMFTGFSTAASVALQKKKDRDAKEDDNDTSEA